MKIKILFFCMIGWVFSTTDWSEQVAKFKNAVKNYENPAVLHDLPYELVKLVERTENGPSDLDEIWKSKLREDLFKKSTSSLTLPKLDTVDFMIDKNKKVTSLHRILLGMAISELYYGREKPDFSSPNLSFCSNLDQGYTELKEVLKKITARKDLEAKDLQFLNNFLNTAWDIVIFEGQTPEQTIQIMSHIVDKILDPNAPNIVALRNNISRLDREKFVDLTKEVILRLGFHGLRQLVNGGNHSLWTIISSTQHQDLLPILYLLVNIFDGKEISSSIPILQKLCAGRLKKIIESLLHKSIVSIINGGDKLEAFKFFDNISEALKKSGRIEKMERIFSCSDRSTLFGAVQAILLKTRVSKILIERSPGEVLKFISELMETGDPRCMDLAEKINGIPVEVPKLTTARINLERSPIN